MLGRQISAYHQKTFPGTHSCYGKMTTVTFQRWLINPSCSFCGLLVIQHLGRFQIPKACKVTDTLMASCWVLKQQRALREPPSQQWIVCQAQARLPAAQKGHLLYSLGPQRRLSVHWILNSGLRLENSAKNNQGRASQAKITA